MIVNLLIATKSTLNAREHWSVRAKRVRIERRVTQFGLTLAGGAPKLPVVVTLTRLSSGTLDGDNLQGALKGVRDQVATWLGADDADPRIEWRYGQERVERGVHGSVRVEVTS